jgi:hypothetical protein
MLARSLQVNYTDRELSSLLGKLPVRCIGRNKNSDMAMK